MERLREGADFTLYRGRERGNQTPVLAVAPAAEQPSPENARLLEHEYSLAAELDEAWAAKPLALTRPPSVIMSFREITKLRNYSLPLAFYFQQSRLAPLLH
jgi:hypothetical protein